MRWTPGGRSPNLEDRRGMGGFGGFGGMGGFGGRGLGFGGMRLGLPGLLLLLLLSFVFKKDFFSLLHGGAPVSMVNRANPALDAKEEPKVQFVSFVLDDAQNTWRKILPAAGAQYRDAKLVLFRNAVNSGCGFAQSATGPFYCPADEKVYIDLGFYDELKNRFGADGDFAQAYVLAHEIGHHVQHILGIDTKVRQAQRANPAAKNELSVRQELQADCLAGIWGHSTKDRNLLEQGDVEKALNAAAAIGDDRIQKMSTGSVRPESFTHGTSQQRMEWFERGFQSGNLADCNTFAR